MCIFALVAFLKPYVFQLRSWFIEHFTSTVHIKRSDETYDMIQSWISFRGLDDAARSLLVKVRTRQKAPRGHDSNTKKALRYAPWEGSFGFWYKNNLLFCKTTQVDVGFHQEEQISVTCVQAGHQFNS
ncbi:hypothetical protein EDB80DRAFT_768935, partial [Ilyonectria destructans]